MLVILIAAFPDSLTCVELAVRAGYSNAKSGGFAAPLARLVELGFVEPGPARRRPWKQNALSEGEGKSQMKKIRAGVQRSLHCRCGREEVLTLGMCATCYMLKRHDDERFGGLREQVLKRDGYCCRVRGASGRRKRSIVVHHRVPGVSRLPLMISLCPACHAIVSRTSVMRRHLPALLLELWREQHPHAHEQTSLRFEVARDAAVPARLFASTNHTSSI